MVAIQLVPAEVQQDQHLGSAQPDHVGHHPLVGLQDGDVGARSLAQRGGDAVVQVGPVGIVHQPIGVGPQRGAYGGGQEVRRGGLAVGPGTMAIRRPWTNLARACGSRVSITLPWMEAPEPRRASREATEARRPAQVAAVSRARAVGEIGMVAINTSRTGWGE